MPTLADLRRLLEMTPDEPARQRAGGTVEGMARHYFARVLWVFWPGQSVPERVPVDVGLTLLRDPVWCGGDVRLDMSEDGTRRALLTGLALALGLDPGAVALGTSWQRNGSDDGWIVSGTDRPPRVFMATMPSGDWPHLIFAPTVATEPDPVRALALAVAHVLSPSGDRAERVSGGDK